MKSRCHLLIFLASLLLLPSLLRAQESDIEAPPLAIGSFENQGSASFGYRFTDIKGFKPMYQELLSLQSGPRLLDFNMSGEAKEGANPFVDSYWLSMSGLGGDPFPTAQFSVTKHRLYDFRVNWRQAYYFWNQNDGVVLPIASLAGVTTGLTSNHNWNTVRKFGNVDFTLHATDHLRFRFNYYRTSDTGTTFTTFSPDFGATSTDPGAPASWGSFARANPYSLLAPINDETNRFTGGVDYTYHSWNLHYALGYQTFNANTTLTNVTSPELSIDPIATSLAVPLASSNWSEFRRLTTPISEFSFVGKPLKRLEWRGGYIYYRYRGPFSFDQSFNGTGPTSSTTYAVSQTARGTLNEPDHIVNMGFTYDVKDWWSVSADYRYSRMVSQGIGNLASLFTVFTTPTTATITPATDVEDNVWRNNISDLKLYMDFTPFRTLMIRPGVRFIKDDVVSSAAGVVDPTLTQSVKTVSPEISVGFEPSKKFTFRGDLHSFNNGFSYTAITPHTQVGGHAVIQFHPIKKLSIDNDFTASNSSLAESSYRNSIRSDAITVSYAFSDRFSLFAGFTYESFFSQGDILYVRGTAPLTDFLRDQEINRVWQGGVQLKPTKRLGVRFSGNYDRSTGLAAITGVPPATSPATWNEPPAYGPVTWPLATGSVYYNFPKLGQLAVDLQRTYYLQEIVPGNNFSANLLTVRWTRGF